MFHKLTKFHKEILVGFGTNKYNPTQASDNRIRIEFCDRVWIFYDGSWYLTSLDKIIPFVKEIKEKTYNIHQLEEKVINVII